MGTQYDMPRPVFLFYLSLFRIIRSIEFWFKHNYPDSQTKLLSNSPDWEINVSNRQQSWTQSIATRKAESNPLWEFNVKREELDQIGSFQAHGPPSN